MPPVEIATPPDFSFPATVVSHGWYLLAPFSWQRERGVLRRVETIGERAWELEISHDGAALVVSSTRDPAAVARPLARRLTRMFQLDVDLEEFHRKAARRRSHRGAAELRFGRLLCGSSVFEDVVKIIATTNTTWRQTMRMVELLTMNYGRRARSGGHAFPTPESLAGAREEDLRERCRLGYRSRYVLELARGVASGAFDLDALHDQALDSAALLGRYRTLPGIGPYGAAHLLAMEGRHDFIAIDTEFRRFVRERHFGGAGTADRDLAAHYEPWGRWKYLAYWWELWDSIAPQLEAFEQREAERREAGTESEY
jgi:3-methyladenine DNA glycosylase/8-oxoguanine DNA glycosylase